MTNGDALAGKRVVVCEDEGVTVMQLERALTRAGMTVAGCAPSGEECVRTVLRERPDIVLMDVTLEGMDGVEATRQIMASAPTCVVMLTGQSDGEQIERARAYGASAFITKPVSSDLLLPQISQALQTFYECEA